MVQMCIKLGFLPHSRKLTFALRVLLHHGSEARTDRGFVGDLLSFSAWHELESEMEHFDPLNESSVALDLLSAMG